jgi:hypothetical protein
VRDEGEVAHELAYGFVCASVDLLLDCGQGYGLLDGFVVFWNDTLVDLLVEQLRRIEATDRELAKRVAAIERN